MPEIPAVYQNRELSWIKFNKRVLEEASDGTLPLMERLTFAAIYMSNLDEFLRVRGGALLARSLKNDEQLDNKSLMRPSEQLSAVYREVRTLQPLKDKLVTDLDRALAEKGIRRLEYERLSPAMQQRADDLFYHSIKPFLNTYILDSGDSFPFIESGRIYAVLRLENERGSFTAVVSDTAEHERMLTFTEDGFAYILAEDILIAKADTLFSGYTVTEKMLIRASRSAAVTLDDEPNITSDRLEAMSLVLAKRRVMQPVRLQILGSCTDLTADMLAETLDVGQDAVFIEHSPLEMKYVFALRDILAERSELFYTPYQPVIPKKIAADRPIHQQAAEKDILLSYPYESMEPFLRLLEEAAEDDSVLSVKMTLYRVADGSRVIAALCRAAQNGKQVTVCTELRARFDEQHNIDCSKQLIAAGCRVIHGMPFIKVHSKLCLITRMVNGEPLYVTQIGTGNYNERTALQYADFTLMTADPVIARDADRVFAELENGMVVTETSALLVSPQRLRMPLAAMIDDEIRLARSGADAYIGLKMNGLTDKLLIDKLIEASQAGVKTDLIVRGVCCLTAGVTGYTENIRIISIVGRYLEHSRIYIFGKGERQAVYISSADLMTRNTTRRVEAAVRINDPDLKARLIGYFGTQLDDDCSARVMLPDGSYERLHDGHTDCQKVFAQQAQESAAKPEPAPPTLPEQPPEILPEPETPQEEKPPEKKRGLLRRILDLFRRKKK